jgi:hypothetical protein
LSNLRPMKKSDNVAKENKRRAGKKWPIKFNLLRYQMVLKEDF